MISVRCPACGKIVGFDESDGGALVACPHCREPFFVPSVARPVIPGSEPAQAEPPVVARLPPAPVLPDDISVADEPVLEVGPPANQEMPPEPAAPPESVPLLELDPPTPAGTPTVVKPTDVAPSLAAASSLSEALPPPETEAERPAELLDEVRDEAEPDERFYEPEAAPRDEDDEEGERRRRRRRSEVRGRKSYRRRLDKLSRPEEVTLTINRALGGAGVAAGGMILLGTLIHHLTASQSAWHAGVCCGDLFGVVLLCGGLYLLIKG